MIRQVENTEGEGWSLVALLLDEQQRTTAVEKFSQLHDERAFESGAVGYRDLIPNASPGRGEQYAFDVDLDACSGCKACVTACHNLNGLETHETWRSVGLLTGGTSQLPVLQHVTTACHHCLDPACMDGCPVAAYEKDPATGIVRHLDDQCIGCQYCIFKCPYDVPKYSSAKGIVRKCDMCSDRLAGGEAPACVQACPNGAIRISVVDQQTVLDESEANAFLPGAPEPGYTIPSTVYRTKRALPRNMLPADYHAAAPQHAHLPLVVMLVLTQMSVGAFVLEHFLAKGLAMNGAADVSPARLVHLIAALCLGFLGMSAAVLHLGRPWLAYRSWIGLRTSWLSREILAFGLFALFASIYAAIAGREFTGAHSVARFEPIFGFLAAASGVAGIVCSVMIYVDTRRDFWSGPSTALKFFGTSAVLGLPLAVLIGLAGDAISRDPSTEPTIDRFGLELCQWLVVVVTAKLLVECSSFSHLRDRQHTPLRRTASLMTGELSLTTLKRFFFGIVGGVVLPGLLVAGTTMGSGEGFRPAFVAIAMTCSLLFLLIGELLERYLFFAAVVAPRMPGAPSP